MLTQHAAAAAKVTAGGAAVGGGSYVVTEKVLQATEVVNTAAQAQAWAVVAASAMTALYFAVMAGRTGWLWWQDIKASRKKA